MLGVSLVRSPSDALWLTLLHVGKLLCSWCDVTKGLLFRSGSRGPCLGEVPMISGKKKILKKNCVLKLKFEKALLYYDKLSACRITPPLGSSHISEQAATNKGECHRNKTSGGD